jgi:5'-deoxynucleotidase
MQVVSHFFAYLARMKYIQRWGLMRNTRQENIQEHSLQVAMVAHALALIDRDLFGGDADPDRTALLAVYHDAEEVITGDLPTPIKYFSPRIAAAIDDVEEVARQRLLSMLPEGLRASYQPLLQPDAADAASWRLVKLADRTCAFLKCVEEAKAGNGEFGPAQATIRNDLDEASKVEPALAYFLEVFVPSFELTLDELN